MAVVESRGHQVGRLVAGETKHDALVAGTFVVVAAGIDALRDVRRPRVQVVLEAEALPVKPALLVTDLANRATDGVLHFLLEAWRPVAVLIHDPVAADLAGKDHQLGGRQRLTGDARLGVLGQEHIDDRVRDLVGDFVRMAFGDTFGREQVALAHREIVTPR